MTEKEAKAKLKEIEKAMKAIATAICFLSILSPLSVHAIDKECELEPRICHLTGRLEIQSHPGPPNYEDIKKGDEEERGLYLRLDRPLTVHFEEEGKQKRESISVIHLTGDLKKKHFEQGHAKKRVNATGTLFEWFNGHHHSHFLMDVNHFSEVNK